MQLSYEDKNLFVEICSKYNQLFKSKLNRDFLPDLLEGFKVEEEALYIEILHDNIFEVDSDFSLLTPKEIKLIKIFGVNIHF